MLGRFFICHIQGHEFEPQPGHIAFVESDHEIISIFLPSVDSKKSSCRLLAKVYVCALSSGNRQGISLSRKSVSRLTIASMCIGCPDRDLRK